MWVKAPFADPGLPQPESRSAIPSMIKTIFRNMETPLGLSLRGAFAATKQSPHELGIASSFALAMTLIFVLPLQKSFLQQRHNPIQHQSQSDQHKHSHEHHRRIILKISQLQKEPQSFFRADQLTYNCADHRQRRADAQAAEKHGQR